MTQCGAYKESWKWLGKPSDWKGCSLPLNHKGDHLDYNLARHQEVEYVSAKEGTELVVRNGQSFRLPFRIPGPE